MLTNICVHIIHHHKPTAHFIVPVNVKRVLRVTGLRIISTAVNIIHCEFVRKIITHSHLQEVWTRLYPNIFPKDCSILLSLTILFWILLEGQLYLFYIQRYLLLLIWTMWWLFGKINSKSPLKLVHLSENIDLL